jgi:hypothetical protein
VPSEATGFQLGYANGYVTHARMAAQSTEPTHEQLEAIAMHTVADDSAWADYPLVWKDGAPYLKDQSGHDRDLELKAGGALYAGPEGPSF